MSYKIYERRRMDQKEVAKRVISLHQDLKKARTETEARMETLQKQIEALLHYMGGSTAPKEISRQVRLLEVISKHDQGLRRDKFYEEAKKVGYPDPRGLAGFFKPQASLTYVSVAG